MAVDLFEAIKESQSEYSFLSPWTKIQPTHSQAKEDTEITVSVKVNEHLSIYTFKSQTRFYGDHHLFALTILFHCNIL